MRFAKKKSFLFAAVPLLGGSACGGGLPVSSWFGLKTDAQEVSHPVPSGTGNLLIGATATISART